MLIRFVPQDYDPPDTTALNNPTAYGFAGAKTRMPDRKVFDATRQLPIAVAADIGYANFRVRVPAPGTRSSAG